MIRRYISWTATAVLFLPAILTHAVAGPLGTITLKSQTSVSANCPNRTTDIWGYVANGREYAIMGCNFSINSFFVFDVTDPTNPVQESMATLKTGFDVKVYGDLVYTVTGSPGSGGGVFNISNVNQPIKLNSIFDTQSSHNLFIDSRGYLYQSDAGIQRGVRIWDLNVSTINPPLISQDNIAGAHDLSVVGTILYDFHGTGKTRILDVSDPTSPQLLGDIDSPSIRYHHSGYPTEDGKYLFICDELASNPAADITVWNIEDPANAFQVAAIADPTATVHNLYIIGDYAYVSHYTAGFKVYDVSDPTNPQLADEFDTSALAGEGFEGAFGVYPFGPSGNIYISDKDNGLYVFSFEPATPAAVTFAAFNARYRGNAVQLSWGVASADGLRGFNIYRSPQRDHGYVQLNTILISDLSARAWEDRSVEQGKTYYYRVGAIDNDGEFLSVSQEVVVPRTGVVLHQNAPNPFNPTTTITYELPATSAVTLGVYDARGARVRVLIDDTQSPGRKNAVWDGRDDSGSVVASGVYFYRLTVDGRSQSRSMLLLK